jgi:outer membrane lipase/esterase
MRDPHAPVWARSVAFAAALLSAVVGFTASAAAQAKFDRLFVFGDSYADLTLSDATHTTSPPGVALGFWRVYPLPLAKDLHISDTQIVDFAVGGATASGIGATAVPPFWHLEQQVTEFLKTGEKFGSRDLVTLNIGGNDGLRQLAFMTPATAPDFAKVTADDAFRQIDRLVTQAGARNLVLGEFTSLAGLLGIPIGDPTANAFGAAYFNGMQTRLLPLAETGVRFFMLDLYRLGQQVQADPSKYGLARNPAQGDLSQCSPNGLPAPFNAICGGSIKSPDQNKFFLGPDSLHLTNAGFAIVAAYMDNIVMAPDTIAVQPGIVASTTSAFTGSVLGRLDAMRGQRDASGYVASTAPGGPMGLGYGDDARARPTAPSSHLTAYAMGTFVGGTRSDSFAQVGFDYEAPSGTVGLEYSANRNLIIGLAGNFTATNADLNGGASIDVDTLQAAAYISYATRQMFAEALVAYGHHDLDLVRPGVIDTVRSSTDANSFAAAARGAYLFDFGSLRAGPIAGLTYIRSRVDGYTENGDSLLTYNVSAQTIDSLVGNVGVQFRTQFLVGGNLVSPFMNITLEHQFGDNMRTMTANLTQAPLLPILSAEPNFESRSYGRVEGGVTLQIGPGVSATVNAASTFARDEGNDFRISTGLNYRF